jgi:hypothetical protein
LPGFLAFFSGWHRFLPRVRIFPIPVEIRLRDPAHHSHHSFDNIVNIGEIPLHLSACHFDKESEREFRPFLHVIDFRTHDANPAVFHPAEIAQLEEAVDLPIGVGTVNLGSGLVGSGLLANSRGVPGRGRDERL